ncbi:MAG: iron ABC transporter permease [Phycisphaerales bacterium]
MKTRQTITLAAVGAGLAIAVVWRLGVGGDGFALPENATVWELRGVRAAAAAVVGAALAVGGVMLQSLLRNPLASPDLIGASSGAGLVVAVAAYLQYLVARGEDGLAGGLANELGGALGGGAFASLGLAALVGSLGALALVYALSQRRGVVDPVTMILVGVIVSVIAGAATVFVQSLMPPQDALVVQRWMLGRVSDDIGWSAVAIGGVLVGALAFVGVALGGAMDASALGDDEARSVGVSLGILRAVLFVASGVLTAAAVVLAGPIGFVGLVCPHVVRLGAGPAHRVVVIGSVLAGAALLVAADAGVKSFSVQTGRVPIGVLTALIGGPVFLWLLLREMRRR